MIVGPAIGDNAIVATPFAERAPGADDQLGRLRARRSEYMFHLQVGSHEDESIVLARHMASIGARSGRRGVRPLADRPASRRLPRRRGRGARARGRRPRLGVHRSPRTPPPRSTGCSRPVPTGCVYLGLGLAAPAVAKRAHRARVGRTTRAMNTAGMRGHDPEFGRVDRRLGVHRHVRRRQRDRSPRCRAGGPPSETRMAVAKGYDLGRLVAEGLAHAPSARATA